MMAYKNSVQVKLIKIWRSYDTLVIQGLHILIRLVKIRSFDRRLPHILTLADG